MIEFGTVVNNCALDLRTCNGEEGGNPPKPVSVVCDLLAFRVGVAWTDINIEFLSGRLFEGFWDTCEPLGKLEAGTKELSAELTNFEDGLIDSNPMSLRRTALGVAVICTFWKNGFRIGFLDSGTVSMERGDWR